MAGIYEATGSPHAPLKAFESHCPHRTWSTQEPIDDLSHRLLRLECPLGHYTVHRTLRVVPGCVAFRMTSHLARAVRGPMNVASDEARLIMGNIVRLR